MDRCYENDLNYDDSRIASERAKIEAQELAKGVAQQASQDQEAALAKMNK